jgi:hypothetical protein
MNLPANKPVLDVDAYETDPYISEIIADINKVFPDKPVYYDKRDLKLS